MLRLSMMLILTGNICFAQQMVRSVVSAAGTSTQISNLRIQQTVGESFVSRTIQLNKSAVQQGFHHTSAKANPEDPSFDAMIYPNPGDGWISFQTNEAKGTPYLITLTDLNGKVILQREYTSTESIDIHWVNSGMYFVTLSNTQYAKTLPYSKIK